MAVTASLVKELRERTGLGMMECKKALVETDGDIEKAIENLRKSGQAKAAKKAGRIAAEGGVFIKVNDAGNKGVMVEINSETDFVARDDNFLGFADLVAQRALETSQVDVAALMVTPVEEGGSQTLEQTRQALVQKIGENIQVRRIVMSESAQGTVGAYVHSQKIGVLVSMAGGEATLGKDVAMHVAASSPLVVKPEDVPQDVLDKEKAIFAAQAKESGKPDEIVEKMVVGRVKKYLAEVSLIEQAFVKDPDVKVGALVKQGGADIQSFVRYEVGEGIEKEETDFAAEVMAQVRGD